MAEMEATQRAAIFELRGRTPPVPYAKIAEHLGISESQVYREHKREAPSGRNGGEVGPTISKRTAERSDPEFDAAEKRVELLRLTLQEHELQRRLALLDGKVAGQDSAIGPVISLMSEQMRRIEENMDRRLAMAQPSRAPEDPMQALVKSMSVLGQLKDQAALLAPPAPVSGAVTAADVELRVLLERMNLESETVRHKAAAEAARWDKAWSLLESNAPMILEGVKTYFANNSKRQEQGHVSTLTVLPGGETIAETNVVTEVPMTCATCASKFMVRPEEGELPTCTVCGGPLQPDAMLTAPATPKPFWPEDATFG